LNELNLLLDLFKLILVPFVKIVKSILDLLLENSDGLLLVIGNLVQKDSVVENKSKSEAVDSVLLGFLALKFVFFQHLVVLLSLLVQVKSFLFVFLALFTIAELSHIPVNISLHLLEKDESSHHTSGIDAVIVDDSYLSFALSDEISQ
jgi:hypothetical protein